MDAKRFVVPLKNICILGCYKTQEFDIVLLGVHLPLASVPPGPGLLHHVVSSLAGT